MVEGESQEVAVNKYTFGDNLRASARLRRLAEIYEPESRELLRRSGINRRGWLWTSAAAPVGPPACFTIR